MLFNCLKKIYCTINFFLDIESVKYIKNLKTLVLPSHCPLHTQNGIQNPFEMRLTLLQPLLRLVSDQRTGVVQEVQHQEQPGGIGGRVLLLHLTLLSISK